MSKITTEILALRDKKHQDFLAKLIPNISKNSILGIKVPTLRTIAKKYQYTDEAENFLNSLPHTYLEENIIHTLLLENIHDIDEAIQKVKIFLPYINNWAVCDVSWPKIFKKYPERTLAEVHIWLQNKHPYVLRYAIWILLTNFLDDTFSPEMLELVAKVSHEDYYVQMMQAWYFATALTKQYSATISIIEAKTLRPWIQNKTIQKARESRRIEEKTKEYLKKLKV